MAFTHKGKKYNSKKHPVLEHIFFKKKPNKKTSGKYYFYAEGYIRRLCGV